MHLNGVIKVSEYKQITEDASKSALTLGNKPLGEEQMWRSHLAGPLLTRRPGFTLGDAKAARGDRLSVVR